MNTWGHAFRVTIAGESHGTGVLALADGVPPGIPLDTGRVQAELDRRRPGQSAVTTARSEADAVEILSGTLDGRTTGAPVTMLIRNEDVESGSYTPYHERPRPGHADVTARLRYADWNDLRGGGMFSGRLTAGWVMAGALAQACLDPLGIEVGAHTIQVGPLRARSFSEPAAMRAACETNPVRTADADIAPKMVEMITEARSRGDSLGGSIETVGTGVPPGLGDPLMAKVEAQLAHACMSLPATRGVLFGPGEALYQLHGSEANDPWAWDEAGRLVTRGSRHGGVLGGITTGMPLRAEVLFKPPSTIAQAQDTVNLATGGAATLESRGRHDPCVVPRAVPIVEAVVRVVLLDQILRAGGRVHGR